MQQDQHCTIDRRVRKAILNEREDSAHNLGRYDRDHHRCFPTMVHVYYRDAYQRGWAERDREILGAWAYEVFN